MSKVRTCAAFNWVLMVTKKKLRINGFFASLPFLTYLCITNEKTKTINTLCSILKKNSQRAWALSK